MRVSRRQQMNKHIPIFYACDDNFVKFTMISMKSLMENASKNYEYVIHILYSDISDEMKKAVLEMKTDNFSIQFDDVTDYMKSINDKLPIRDYYTKTTYYRLFIAEMFEEYNKAIYIDSDTIVLGDVSKLYNHDLGDNYVGAANEQAMVQTETYGQYVEKVLGIDRHEFFNAGVLLINCCQFRDKNLLGDFVALLKTYNFVVTQDEDYLNLICKGHVLWIEQQWNTEVYGNIPYDESEFNIIHYIMISKPWHFDDCRFKEYFWKYAKMTTVYDEIKQLLIDYTDEERNKDIASGVALEQTAKNEIAKEDNYLNMREAGKLKSKERLEVLEKIAKLESEGRFDEDVEEDPPTRELLPDEVDYLRKKMKSKVKSRFTYAVARAYMNKLIKNKQLLIKDICGLENYKNLQTGAVITCNHFNALDSFAMQIAYEASMKKDRKFFRVIREGNFTNFPGFYGMLMRNCNTFPLSSNKKTMAKFLDSVDKILRAGHFLLIYPEQSMWWNYRKPKPLKKGAYNFAVKSNVPILPCFITMRDSDILDENGFYVQEYTIHISKPIYPDETLSKAENVRNMMNENFDEWKKIYETTYGEKLEYSCEIDDFEKTTA